MLGKGIESALVNPSALVSEPWVASGETLSGIDPESMAVEPALVLSIQVSFPFQISFSIFLQSILFFSFFYDKTIIMQAYVDAVLDLASHFITRLRRYASFCRTLASHAVTAGTGSNRSMVGSPPQSSASPAAAAAQGQCALHLSINPKMKNELYVCV